ncbi:thioredoxin H2 [Rhodamnia argentea]|uniref:Thioredoxin H2 n=1 Tax=Rhodamnia argentea TaxID=178133 RepID=A0A8B8MU14_9MYRT|nr:thioredoxin H2 [Rhodamnia argentea]
MGSFLSRLLGAPSDGSSESSRVQAFHSAPQWQLHFNTVKETSQLMVIDFAASWCGPCRMMEPAVNAMATQFADVEFAKIDVDELSDVAREFGVQAMPTFVLVKKGTEVDRIVGANKDELERKIQRHRALVAAS